MRNPWRRKKTVRPRLTLWQRVRWQAVRLVKLLVILYLVVGLLLDVLQRKLIFVGASTQGTVAGRVDAPPFAEVVHLHAADGTPITGLFLPATYPEQRRHSPTILFFYGNAMCMADAVGLINVFDGLGVNVMLVDYEGYGMSGGKASEDGCYAAAEAAYQYLVAHPDIDSHKIIIAGWSLGAAVALDLAARHAGDDHLAGVMSFSGFTSMVDEAKYHYPIYPISLMLRYRLMSIDKMPRISAPILLGHGERDDIVPFAMRDRLAAAATGSTSVTKVTLADASHNDFFDEDQTQLHEAIGTFLASLPAER